MYRCIWRIYLCNVVQQPRSENCRFVQPTGQKRFKLDTGFWQNKTFCSLSNNLQGRFVVQVLSKRRFIFISHKLQSSMKTRLEPESPFTFQCFVKKNRQKRITYPMFNITKTIIIIFSSQHGHVTDCVTRTMKNYCLK